MSQWSETARVMLGAPTAWAGDDPIQVFGVTLVGVSRTTGVKLLFTLALVTVVLLLRFVLMRGVRRVLGGDVADPRRFWARQGLQLLVAVILVVGVLSIWITPGTDITTGLGLISAGLAFALQQVIVSLAAYFVILRGDTFGVGDRITLGGVRGDVVRLGFLRTTIMEMGQPPSVAAADPAVWVNSRQYTGRLVTVTNGAIFSDPVYNYTRDFPYLWEELVLPVGYESDRARAEQILLDAARTHAIVDDPEAVRSLALMRSRYAMADASLQPAVYWRITDSWVELSVRFLVPQRGVREIKDAMSRDILTGLDGAGIPIASATYGIVGLPDIRISPPVRGPLNGGRKRSAGLSRCRELCDGVRTVMRTAPGRPRSGSPRAPCRSSRTSAGVRESHGSQAAGSPQRETRTDPRRCVVRSP